MGGLNISDMGTVAPILLVLLGLSVASVAIIFARAIALRGVAAENAAREALLASLERGDIAQPGFQAATPADRVALRAAELFDLRASSDLVTSDLTGLGNAEVARMARGLRPLDLIGMIAPLLGLLGTVLGMIQSFRSLELAAGSANASILAGGIWQALLTTAAGLVVAIPALVGASYLSGRVEAGTLRIERVIQRASVATARRTDSRRAAE
ncbi:MotA/TolQ/ExbB proton channel family protein [Tropicimonas sp. S265A]|uniref:MotA/TolQ/ExbB proton channel family protein n=1 Tax=Tropicimonas sp. S265A TaxID=3415134 RepID=UPI003C7E7BE9